jgi:hypothetical protein
MTQGVKPAFGASRYEWQQIIVISGGQPAYSLVAWMVLDPSDAVWLEDPGQPAAGDAFLAAGAWLVPVPVDERGLNVAEGVARCKRARLAYVTPSRQHPPSQKRTLLTQAMGNRILQYRILFASEGLLSAPNAKRRDCWVMTLV